MANEDTPSRGWWVGPPRQGSPTGCEVGARTIAALREHCPWMGALTHESLVEYLLEEAYEVAETIEACGGDAELQAELGDVLLQVVLHARLAEERGAFDLDDVARGLTAKMIRRNPHVFRPDGSLQDSFPATVQEIVATWDAVKMAEKPDRRAPAFDGVPAALPALARAQKLLDRAERAGLPADGTGSAVDVPAGDGGARGAPVRHRGGCPPQRARRRAGPPRGRPPLPGRPGAPASPLMTSGDWIGFRNLHHSRLG